MMQSNEYHFSSNFQHTLCDAAMFIVGDKTYYYTTFHLQAIFIVVMWAMISQ